MSVKVMTMVWAADLGSPVRKLIALKLADCANDKGESIYPSVSTIAAETGIHRRTVEKTMADLRRDGLLRVTRRGGWKAGPTRYRMHLPWLHERQREGGGTGLTPGGTGLRPDRSVRDPRSGNQRKGTTYPVRGRRRNVRAADISANPMNAWGVDE